MRHVSDVMTRQVETLRETDNLAHIDMLLQHKRIRHLPVVRGDKLVGLVTHRDLLRVLHCMAEYGPSKPLWVMDVMRRDVSTVHPETPLREAIHLALENKYGCLPVVDGRDILVGIVTEADFARVAAYLLDDVERYERADEFRA